MAISHRGIQCQLQHNLGEHRGRGSRLCEAISLRLLYFFETEKLGCITRLLQKLLILVWLRC